MKNIKITVLEDVRIEDGEIVSEISCDEIRERLDSGEMFVAKNVFPKEHTNKIITDVFEHYHHKLPQLLPYRWNQENHWRLDDNPPKSTIKKCLALYFSFMWNAEFLNINKTAKMLGSFRNKIADLPAEYGFLNESDHWVIPTIQHLPQGGGFLGKHSDPLSPDRCVISLYLSTRGVDYEEGGLTLEDFDGTDLDIDNYLSAGDLFIFRPDVPHKISAIDPDKELDFSSVKGRWRMAAVLNPAVT